MDAKLRKATLRQFSARLKEEFPRFTRMPPDAVAGLGSVVYVWEVARNFCFFLELGPSQKWLDECFIIDIGWNVSREYPRAAIGKWYGGRMPPETSPFGLLRLPILYKDKWLANAEPWWYLGPEPAKLSKVEMAALRLASEGLSTEERRTALHLALEKKRNQVTAEDESLESRLADIPAKVADAIQKFKEFGLPYLMNIARAHHVQVPRTHDGSA
jgi:hypothetical protein